MGGTANDMLLVEFTADGKCNIFADAVNGGAAFVNAPYVLDYVPLGGSSFETLAMVKLNNGIMYQIKPDRDSKDTLDVGCFEEGKMGRSKWLLSRKVFEAKLNAQNMEKAAADKLRAQWLQDEARLRSYRKIADVKARYICEGQTIELKTDGAFIVKHDKNPKFPNDRSSKVEGVYDIKNNRIYFHMNTGEIIPGRFEGSDLLTGLYSLGVSNTNWRYKKK